MAKNTQQNWTRGFLQHQPMFSGFAAVFLVFFLEAELTLPDLSLGRCLADPLNPGHPRSCVSVRLSLSCPQDQESRPSAGHSQK